MNISHERDTRESRGWKQAAVGCYWTRGDYTIASTSTKGQHGYVAFKNREPISEIVSFEEAEDLCNRRIPAPVRFRSGDPDQHHYHGYAVRVGHTEPKSSCPGCQPQAWPHFHTDPTGYPGHE